MNIKWRNICAILLLLVSSLFFQQARAQQSLTSFLGWNAYVHLPAGYATSGKSYPTIIFFPGIGEVGTNSSAVIANGPGAYITQGWDGNVNVDGSTVEFIVISLQPPGAFPTEFDMNLRLQVIKSYYRVDADRIYLTGLSHGGWCSTTFVTGDPLGGPYNYASQIAAVVTVEGMIPDDNQPYPALFDNFALSGGKYIGFEQKYDGRDTRTVVDRMNATVPNSAVYVQTNFGGGGHCCWNEFYGGQGNQPGIFMLSGLKQTLYQWLARQSRSNSSNLPPVSNAGPDINITLPTSTVVLNGTGTDQDGKITSFAWNQIAGPAAATITSNATAITSVSNLLQGSYLFTLKVTDNLTASSLDTVQVTVNSNPANGGCNSNAPVTWYLNNTLPGEIYRPNGSMWKGGDTVKITGTNYSAIEFYNIAGDPCRPIVIMPQTTLTTPVFRFKGNSRYIKLWGGPTKYGIKITPGTLAITSCNHIEVDNVECSWGSNGVYCKQDVVYADTMSWYPNYRMTKLTFKNMWIHDINGEGMYLGITQPDGLTVRSTYSGLDTVIVPIRLDSVEVSNCLVERTTWDGIQLSNARNGNKIYNNTVLNYGTLNISSQQAGIILGGNCNGDIYGNTIKKGTGNGIQIFGFGVINVYNNSLDSCGYDGNTNPNGTQGQQSIYASDFLISTDNNPPQTLNVYGNSINRPKSAGGVFITDYYNNSAASSVYNNGFCIPSAPSDWQSIYIKAYVPGTKSSNNTLSCSGVNIAPLAKAGPDLSITLPVNSVSLDGSGTDTDGNIISYQWSKIAGPIGGNITSGTSASTTITGLTQGTYYFKFSVTDNGGAVGSDTVQVTVKAAPNVSPTANAGGDISITLPTNTVTLNGVGNDADGTISGTQWIKISGPLSGSISAASAATTTITGLVQGIYLYKFTVTDNAGATASDTVMITVNGAPNISPTANAGADINITLPTSSASLNGVATDTDGSIVSYKWTKLTGPATGIILTPGVAISNLTGLTEGVYTFELTVTDNSGSTAADTVKVTVNAPANNLPTANAGTDITITLPNTSANLTGSGADVDGTVASYQWTKLSGPFGGTISTPLSASTTVTGLTQGTYYYELTVTDNAGAHGSDTVKIAVIGSTNSAPSANAGADITLTLPNNSTSLNGAGTDNDGTIASYQWSKITGPAAGTLGAASSATTTLAGLTQGIYTYQLTVTDNGGAVGRDTIKITVNGAANVAPSANAGADIILTLPNSSTTLNGTGIDNDGTVASYQWTKVAGPAAGTLGTASSATTTLSGLTQGVYTYQLTVTDNAGAAGIDTIKITVNGAANVAPSAHAGADIILTLPNNATSLNGAGTDIDGTIASYQWTKISGPPAGIIGSPSTAVSQLTGLVQGIYTYQLSVTDNLGASGRDTIRITVNSAANIVPTANAGSDISLTLPTNSALLSGSGSDIDGSIVSYQWLKISGPAAGTIASSSSVTTGISSLVQGNYAYQLIVTDNAGAVGRDTVHVTVNAAPNLAPKANAGSDITLTLPANSATLSGSGSDADGNVASYQWLKISGPSGGTLSNSLSAVTSLTALTEGVYSYQLTVIDNAGGTGKDTLKITVLPANNVTPTANAGVDISITLPSNTVLLSGIGNDPDGNIVSYQWSKITGPVSAVISNPAMAATNVTGLSQGTYFYQLLVTDNSGATARDTVKVTVNPPANLAPKANAGQDLSIMLPTSSIILSGSGSDADGTVSAYQWIKIAGPATGSIVNSTSASTLVNNLTQGVYHFQLTVTDNSGASAKDTITVTVNSAPVNIAPHANAGPDITIYLPENKTILNGSGTDTDGSVVSYTWKVLSGPSRFVFSNVTSSQTLFSDLRQGNYEIELAVTDNGGAKGFDTVLVSVGSSRTAPSEVADLAVYPNPVNVVLNAQVKATKAYPQVKLLLYDGRGKLVYQKQIVVDDVKIEKIDMSRMSSGVYILHAVYDDKTRISKKVIKN